MFNVNLEKRVMRVIRQRIKEVQVELNKEHARIDREAEMQKIVATEAAVEQILGKVL